MAEIGERVSLKILREQPLGAFLDAGHPLGEILLPRHEVPKDAKIGDQVEVFLYNDSQDRPIATLKTPKVMPDQYAFLEVLHKTEVGAFLDWGLPKDLLLPFSEQRDQIQVGKSYIVYVRLDQKTKRLIATQRLRKHLDYYHPTYQEGQKVDLLIFGKTDLGYKAIINNHHSGVLFHNQVFRKLHHGERTEGYIKEVREDRKIDLSLYPPGRTGIEELETLILHQLEKHQGHWHLCDTSPATEIYETLGISKKLFKKATGSLYKKRLILIEKNGLHLPQLRP